MCKWSIGAMAMILHFSTNAIWRTRGHKKNYISNTGSTAYSLWSDISEKGLASLSFVLVANLRTIQEEDNNLE